MRTRKSIEKDSSNTSEKTLNIQDGHSESQNDSEPVQIEEGSVISENTSPTTRSDGK